jgi:Neuraminidase (sialidase)
MMAAGVAGGGLLRGVEVDAPVVISQTPELFCGWPTVARRKDGTLLLVYSGGRQAHVCPFGRVELMRSQDDGATWSAPEVLMDTVIDDRDAGVCETGTGALLVTTFTSLAYEAAGSWRPAWEAVQRRSSAAQRKSLLGQWMLRSEDGGMTWSAPYRVAVNSPHGPVALRSGRLLYAGKLLWDESGQAVVDESVDDGKTWRRLAVLPVRPGDSTKQYHELHAVEAGDGRLIVQIRNHNEANQNETLQCESEDGGKTWSVPRPIGVWGLPSHLLRLRDGRLVMTYGYRRAPRGNLARVSADQGKTWGAPVVLSADGTGDLGYPSTVELGDGRLLTVWYEVMQAGTKSVLRMTRWRV